MTIPGQQPLFKVKTESQLKPLTERQTRLYSLFVAAGADGLDAAELGARIHAGQLKHAPGDRCEWCGRDGQRVLRERGIRQRLIRRPGPVYVARENLEQASEPSSQLAELPGETFEDMFRREDAA